jgi:hypothetical protein
LEVPLQNSVASQTPAAGRQTTLVSWRTLAGHDVLEPVHVSAMSQTPATARQTVPAGAGRLCLQNPWSHRSIVHELPSLAHGLPWVGLPLHQHPVWAHII